MHSSLLRPASIVIGLSMVFAVVGCGSDGSADDSSAVTVAAGTNDSGTNDSGTNESGGDTAASDDSSGSDGATPAECTTLTDATGRMILNWQLVAQLGDKPDLTEWPTADSIVGRISELGDQLDTIDAQLGDDTAAAEQIAFMRNANEIVQRGIGGDAAAPAELSDLLGGDMASTLARKTPILQASGDAGC